MENRSKQWGLLCLGWMVVVGTQFAGFAGAAESVDFARDILPVLSKNCVACHNATEAEGGLDLETHASLMQGGENGPAVVPGKADASSLFVRVATGDDSQMPPEDNDVGAEKLSEHEMELLQRWIASGAEASEQMAGPEIVWRELPTNVHPIYALAISPDGQQLAFGKGGSVEVQSVPPTDKHASQSLVDPAMPSSGQVHRIEVQSVAFSPDGQRLATGGYRCVKLWRRSKASSLVQAGWSNSARLVAFAPERNRIAYVTGQTRWEWGDLGTGEVRRYLKSHQSPITGLVWFDDASAIVTCDESGKWMMTSTGRDSSVEILDEPLAVARDLVCVSGTTLLGISESGQLVRVELVEGESAVWSEFPEFSGIVDLGLIGDEAGVVWIATRDGDLLVVDAAGEELNEEAVRRKIVFENPIAAAAVSLEAERIVTIATDGDVDLWNGNDGAHLASLNTDYAETQAMVKMTRQVVRQEQVVAGLEAELKDLVSASAGEEKEVSRIETLRDQAAKDVADRQKESETAVSSVKADQESLDKLKAAEKVDADAVQKAKARLTKQQKLLKEAAGKLGKAEAVVANLELEFKAAENRQEQAVTAIKLLERTIVDAKGVHANLVKGVANSREAMQPPSVSQIGFDRASGRVALACEDQVLRVFSMNDGQPLANVAVSSSIHGLASGAGLLGLSGSGEVSTWDLDPPWELERVIGSDSEPRFSDRITCLDFSPDGRRLAVGSGPPSRFGDVQVLDVATGQVVVQCDQLHRDTVFAVKFSSDGTQLATAAADNLCKLVDASTGAVVRDFEGHTQHVFGIAWADSGAKMATASADATVKIWKVATGEQLRTIKGFSADVTAVSFVGQTDELVSASSNGTVWRHNALDGKLIRKYAGPLDAVFAVGVAADGKWISAGGQLGQLWIWDLESGKQVSPLK